MLIRTCFIIGGDKPSVDWKQGFKFLPVAVTAPARPTAEGSIEIELSSSMRVRVDAAVDEAALGRVLRVLGALGR